MSVTSTPYGANALDSNGDPVRPSYICLLSPPDTGTDVLNAIQTGRHVLRGSSYNTLTLPDGSSRTFSPGGDSMTQYLPVSMLESQGVFYCEVSNRGLTARVPVTILVDNSKFFNQFIYQFQLDLHLYFL